MCGMLTIPEQSISSRLVYVVSDSASEYAETIFSRKSASAISLISGASDLRTPSFSESASIETSFLEGWCRVLALLLASGRAHRPAGLLRRAAHGRQEWRERAVLGRACE